MLPAAVTSGLKRARAETCRFPRPSAHKKQPDIVLRRAHCSRFLLLTFLDWLHIAATSYKHHPATLYVCGSLSYAMPQASTKQACRQQSQPWPTNKPRKAARKPSHKLRLSISSEYDQCGEVIAAWLDTMSPLGPTREPPARENPSEEWVQSWANSLSAFSNVLESKN